MIAIPTTAHRTELQPVALTVSSSELVTKELVARVDEACREVEDRAAGAVLIWLHGEPATAADWPGKVAIDQVNRWERVVRRLERLPASIVAIAGGECAGPAAELLLAADYRVATRDLQLRVAAPGQVAWPGMALFRLVTQLGVARARRAALFGASIGASEALAWSLVDECVATAPQARDRAATIGAELSQLPGKELAIRRRLMFDAAATSFEEALGGHLAACDRTLRSVEVQTDSTPDKVLAT